MDDLQPPSVSDVEELHRIQKAVKRLRTLKVVTVVFLAIAGAAICYLIAGN